MSKLKKISGLFSQGKTIEAAKELQNLRKSMYDALEHTEDMLKLLNNLFDESGTVAMKLRAGRVDEGIRWAKRLEKIDDTILKRKVRDVIRSLTKVVKELD